MDLIYNGVKSFNFRYDMESVLQIIDRMSLEGADAIVLGCTELLIAIKEGNRDIPLIDPTDILAQALLRYSGYELRAEMM